jgi:hypothetical protein
MRQAKPFLMALSVLLLIGAAVAAAEKPKSGKPLTGYNTIVVEKFSVEQTEKTMGFSPRMLESVRAEVIDRLQAERLFAEVIDATQLPAAQPETSATTSGALLLSGTVTEFSKGSRTKRAMIGLGAGASKVKVRFLFRDAQTDTELLRTEHKGKYHGLLGIGGGDEGYAMEEAAGDVVDGLIKDIKNNR